MLIRVLRGAAYLLLCLALPALADTQPDQTLLRVTEAFRLSARISAPGTLHLHWDIAPHYYLYRGRIRLKPADTQTRLGAAQLPAGLKEHDPYLGDVEIYHDALDVRVPYSFAQAPPTMLRVAVTYQGCHEVDPKICYPPYTQTVVLPLSEAGSHASSGAISLPDAQPPRSGSLDAALQGISRTPTLRADIAADAEAQPVATAPAPDAGKSGSEGQSEEQTLAARIGGHGFAAIALFFGFGLLLAFTPCVLPMIPILSGLIVGAGMRISTTRAFVLSLVYVLATSVVFTFAGIIAGLAGANLVAWMQQPTILIAFAILFVLLALSMFGLYSLQLPTSWQTRLASLSNRQRGGSLPGVAVMGVLSALIVGPCVAPPLAAAVLYIGQSHDPVFGGAALFALSLGMGAPLLVIGTAAGRWLPRAGTWMDVIKAFFGVLFLGLAIWMLSRILDPSWILLLTGALLLGCAVYLGALSRTREGASGWHRAGQTLGLIVLLLGACELIGAAANSKDLLRPLAGVFGATRNTATQTPAFRAVKTVDDVQRAIADAGGRPVMLDYYADWCVSCKEMEARTLTDPAVQRALSGFVLLRADVTANDADAQTLLHHYELLGPPADLFFDADGRERRAARLVGYENADDFLKRLRKVNR